MSRFSLLRLFCTFLVVFVASLYFFPLLRTMRIGIDFWLLFLLFYAFRLDWKTAPVVGFFIGIVKDLFSTVPLGIHCLSLTLPTMGLSYLLGKLDREVPLIIILFSFFFSIAVKTVEIGLYIGFRSRPDQFGNLWSNGLVESVWVALLSLPSFYFFGCLLWTRLVRPWKPEHSDE